MHGLAIVFVLGALCSCAQKDEFALQKASVLDAVNDPGSVQFRKLSMCPAEPGLVRGEVNAKNGYGGYVGFQEFYASPSEAHFDRNTDPGEWLNLLRRCSGI